MSAVFRRTSDFFKHYGSRHGSVDSTKSETPDPNAPKMKSPEVEAPIEGSSGMVCRFGLKLKQTLPTLDANNEMQ